MVDVHRYHQISEADHRVLNPLSDEQLFLIADLCELRAGQRQLDLACGKGEMLCQYALRYGITGVGVDVFDGCIEPAAARARELGVDNAVKFVHADASTYKTEPGSFDVVSCIGATWIGDGFSGTLSLMRPPVHDDGWLLIGDTYWTEQPPPEVEHAIGDEASTDLTGILDRVEAAGLDLVEMVLANHDTWDRYSASQWLNVSKWLDEHPEDPEADDVRQTRDNARRDYLKYERRYLGWGVFIIRKPVAVHPFTAQVAR